MLDTSVDGKLIWTGEPQTNDFFLYNLSSDSFKNDFSDRKKTNFSVQNEKVYEGEKALGCAYQRSNRNNASGICSLTFVTDKELGSAEATLKGVDFRKHDYLTFFVSFDAISANFPDDSDIANFTMQLFLSSVENENIQSASIDFSNQILKGNIGSWVKISIPMIDILRPAPDVQYHAVNPKDISVVNFVIDGPLGTSLVMFIDNIELQ